MARFQEKILELVLKIPKGKITTYKELAKAAGSPRAYRTVGNILVNNPRLIKIPCHRVVRSDGQAGGYSQGCEQKIKLLRGEGVEVRDGMINLEKYLINLSREV